MDIKTMERRWSFELQSLPAYLIDGLIFVAGSIFGGIFSRLVPNLLQDYFQGPRLRIKEVTAEEENGEIYYYATVLNNGRRVAEDCVPKLILSGEGELSHWDNPEYGSIESSRKSLWEADKKSRNINRGAEGRFHVLKWNGEYDNSGKVRIPNSGGYDNSTPQNILQLQNNTALLGTDDIRDFQSMIWDKATLEVTSSNAKKDVVHIKDFPWENEIGKVKLEPDRNRTIRRLISLR